MTAMVVSVRPDPGHAETTGERMQVMVNVQAEVLNPDTARHTASIWLLEHAGNLLGAENLELVLGDPLLWRCDVILGLPNLQEPGTGDRYRIGQITMDAVSGEILNTESIAEELQTNAAAAVR